MKQQIEISGMSCGGCVSSVKKALSHLQNVQSVEVTLNPPIAVITSDETYTNDEFSKVLAKAGAYAITEEKAGENSKKSGGSCCG